MNKNLFTNHFEFKIQEWGVETPQGSKWAIWTKKLGNNAQKGYITYDICSINENFNEDGSYNVLSEGLYNLINELDVLFENFVDIQDFSGASFLRLEEATQGLKSRYNPNDYPNLTQFKTVFSMGSNS
ncbi:MAG: hypothetical protein ACRCUS_05765 [Anaerovoracaceae bacterium]